MPELQNSEIFRAVLDGLQTAVCVVDRDSKIIFWNQQAAHATSYMQHEVLGRHCEEFIVCPCSAGSKAEASVNSPLTRILHEGKPELVKVSIRHKRGYSLPVLMHLAPLRNPHGSVVAISASFDTQNSTAESEHVHRILPPLATRDVITGVANHSFTLFHLRESLARFCEFHVPFGILRVTPEAFARFRGYGHEATDAILLVIAQTLSHSFRPQDFVGRWTDDEFLVILANCTVDGVHSVHERVRTTLPSAEIRWWGEQLSVRISVSFTSVELGDTVELLLQRAQPPESSTAAAVGGSPQRRS